MEPGSFTPKPPPNPPSWPAAVCFLGVLTLLGWIAWLLLAHIT